MDLAGAAEEARIWEALVVEVMVALGEVVWEWLYGEGSPWKLMGEWQMFPTGPGFMVLEKEGLMIVRMKMRRSDGGKAIADVVGSVTWIFDDDVMSWGDVDRDETYRYVFDIETDLTYR